MKSQKALFRGIVATTVAVSACLVLASCQRGLNRTEALHELEKHYAHVIPGLDGYYASAEPGQKYENWPDILLHRTDQIGQHWTIRFVNCNPLTLKLNPFIVYVNTHAATKVPRYQDNNVLVKFGTRQYGLQPGDTIHELNIVVDDVDEVHHTATLEQLYMVDDKTLLKYNIDPKEQGFLR